MNSYELSRKFFDWSFENPEKISPTHIAMYFFIIEHCNRLGWKEKFGLPTTMVKDAIGIKNFRTYTNALSDLVDWGFIKMIEKSKNQYSSNIIAIVDSAIATTKALDKALQKHSTKQSESTIQSIDSIDKQVTSNKELIKPITEPIFSFKNSLLNLVNDEVLVSDFLKVRKSKKAVDSETAFNGLVNECEKNNFNLSDALKICCERNWVGFKYDWIKNDFKNKTTQNGTTKTHSTGIIFDKP